MKLSSQRACLWLKKAIQTFYMLLRYKTFGTRVIKAINVFISGTVSIPDAKKGEQIVLITTCKDITSSQLMELFKTVGLPELALPKKVIYMDNPPLLGTGKFDYVTARELALKDEQ